MQVNLQNMGEQGIVNKVFIFDPLARRTVLNSASWWKRFEKSGSLKAYLSFRKAESEENLEFQKAEQAQGVLKGAAKGVSKRPLSRPLARGKSRV